MLRFSSVITFALVSACTQPGPFEEFEMVAGPANGVLVLMGGGANTPDVFNMMRSRALERSPGVTPRLVWIPTAQASGNPTPNGVESAVAAFGAANVQVLHTAERGTADSASFASAIDNAHVVWFDGGRQYRLSDTYRNTATHAAINQLLARGGVVGGTSAGATIQGQYMVRGLRSGGQVVVGTDPVTGAEVKANEVVTGGAFDGLNLLQGAVVDQHVAQRGRQDDLFDFFMDNDPRTGAERLPAGINTGELIGIGIDEPVALVVQGTAAEVWSAAAPGAGAQVRIFDPAKWPAGVVCESSADCQVEVLNVGDRYNLATRARY